MRLNCLSARTLYNTVIWAKFPIILILVYFITGCTRESVRIHSDAFITNTEIRAQKHRKTSRL